jgi:hypothetical protein
MNMLNVECRALAGYTNKEQELFFSIESDCWQYLGNYYPEGNRKSPKWVDGSGQILKGCNLALIPRLKLIKDEWYTFILANNKYSGEVSEIRETSFDIKIHHTNVLTGGGKGECSHPWFIQDYPIEHSFKSFKPMTQEEIQAVKPQFKRGGVVVINLDDGKYMTARLRNPESFNETRNGIEVYSIVGTTGEFTDWDNSGFGFWEGDTVSHATIDQIKQHELDEMKNGKQWNGDAYDDCLTADGLTLNELLEHDLSEIEYQAHLDSIKREWFVVNSSKEELLEFALEDNDINRLRLKSKENFVDVEIEWVGAKGYIKLNDSKYVVNNAWNKCCFVSELGVLSGYRHEGYSSNVLDDIMVFNGVKTKIVSKATHAIFIKVGE